jgi:hypothetical protein
MQDTNIDMVAKPAKSPPASGIHRLIEGLAVQPSQKIPIGKNGAPIIESTSRSSGGTIPPPDC